MSIQYRIYRGDSAGGPIDYSTPVATVAGTSWQTPPLDPGSRNLFGVRAFDTVSGHEERNADAVVMVTVDAAGANVSGLPDPPSDLAAMAIAGAGVRVSWTYNPGGIFPIGFKVWRTVGGSVDYAATPAATVPYSPGRVAYSFDFPGLTDGQTYSFGVRAYNAVGTEMNTLSVSILADGDGPEPVDDFSGSVG